MAALLLCIGGIMMDKIKITTKIGSGKAIHAALLDPSTESINLYCDSLKYKSYYMAMYDIIPPTKENVTCKKCLKQIDKWI